MKITTVSPKKKHSNRKLLHGTEHHNIVDAVLFHFSDHCPPTAAILFLFFCPRNPAAANAHAPSPPSLISSFPSKETERLFICYSLSSIALIKTKILLPQVELLIIFIITYCNKCFSAPLFLCHKITQSRGNLPCFIIIYQSSQTLLSIYTSR